MNDLIFDYINYNKDRIIFKNIDFNFQNKNEKLKHYSIPCVSFTSYLGESKQKINNISIENTASEMSEGKNKEFFSNIFSEFINKYIKVFYLHKEINKKHISLEEYKKTFIILPCISCCKERNYIKFKDLFDSITEKTGINNGYDLVKYNNHKSAISSRDKNYDTFNKSYSIYYIPINSNYNIIFIDDILYTGNTFSNYSRKIIENNKKGKCDSILCISFSQVFSIHEYKYDSLNNYKKLNKKIIETNHRFAAFKIIKNDFYELNPINMEYICFYASKVKYKY